jgi:diadenosine tetraphosphate (Ap4A) HIT family hydrolase
MTTDQRGEPEGYKRKLQGNLMANQTAVRFGYPDTLVREYEHWLVLLREPQATLGSLVLCAKSEAIEYSALPAEAFSEMETVVREIEHALKGAFSYDKINYLMLMMVDPNVHFHVIPRYAEPRTACGLTIGDPGWPALPQLAEAKDISPAQRDELRAFISGYW